MQPSLLRKLSVALPALALISGCGSSDSDSGSNESPAMGGAGSGGASTAGGAGGSGGADMGEPPPAPVPNACITDVTPGVQTLNCEGLDFILSVPESCLDAACGLIMDVHGFGMSGEVMQAHTDMQTRAGAEGFIVVQPTAPAETNRAWSEAQDPAVYSIMQSAISAWHVDPKRIHFDGYSMGGGMTWRFVCKYSDIIASAAPIAAGITGLGAQACAFNGNEPAQQIPIFYTHGRVDMLWRYTAAEATVPAVTAAWFPGVTPETVAEASDYKWERWTNADGNVFEFLQHDWELLGDAAASGIRGHCFPGIPSNATTGLGCGADNAVNWPEAVLQFFLDHPKE